MKFIVLDRINPIDGVTIDGPVLVGPTSFTATHAIPVRHGMTAGELAIMIKKEQGLANLDLHVVPVQGWRRRLIQSQTDLKWINPSPNMRSLTESDLVSRYWLIGVHEAIGRAAEQTRLSRCSERRISMPTRSRSIWTVFHFPGVRFEAIEFKPTASRI